MEGRLKPSAPARRGASRGRAPDAPGLPAPLARLQQAARHGTYFACLDLSPDCTTTEVREAYVGLVKDLDGLRSSAAGAPDLAAALDEVAGVVDDAFAVLSDPDLRLAYRRALLPADGREPWRS